MRIKERERIEKICRDTLSTLNQMKKISHQALLSPEDQ